MESTAKALPNDPALASRNSVVDQLFSQHHDELLRFLRRRVGSEGESRDLAQESYLRLCRQADLERIRGRELAYLFDTANNLIRDRRRRALVRNNVERHHAGDIALAREDETETPGRSLEYKETVAVIKGAISSMSSRTRKVFVLRRFHEVSNRDVAARLGISERTVERRMQKALRRLKRELMKERQPVAALEKAAR